MSEKVTGTGSMTHFKELKTDTGGQFKNVFVILSRTEIKHAQRRLLLVRILIKDKID